MHSLMEFVAYTDESNVTAARYRSICAVTLPLDQLPSVTEHLMAILQDSQVSEFKWEKVRTAKYRFCALKLIDHAIDRCRRFRWRLDVIVWDTQDARHAVSNRDDRKNFERMFFHLLKNAMCRRELNAEWELLPDEKLDVDWVTVRDCLQSAGRWKAYFEHPLLNEAFSEQFFRLARLRTVRSCDEPACQVADLFAGLAAFSRTMAHQYREWRTATAPQQDLLSQSVSPTTSNSERERFAVLDHFAERCRAMTLGVSLRTKGYLLTPNPENPINFWHYQPQHALDRAPTRDDRDAGRARTSGS